MKRCVNKFQELPNTEEIIRVLLSFGKSINATLIDYNHNVYCQKITARYYSTDGLIENYTTICIFINFTGVIVVQIDDDICTYNRFKGVYHG